MEGDVNEDDCVLGQGEEGVEACLAVTVVTPVTVDTHPHGRQRSFISSRIIFIIIH